MIAGGSAGATRMGGASREVSRAVGFDEDEAATGGPLSDMARLAESAETTEQIQRFETPGGRPSVLRNCELSLKCVASGVRSRG